MAQAYAVPGKCGRESLDHPAGYGDWGKRVLDWAWEDRALPDWTRRKNGVLGVHPDFVTQLGELYADGCSRFAAQS